MLGLAVFFLTFFASKNMGKEILSGDSPLEKTLQENKWILSSLNGCLLLSSTPHWMELVGWKKCAKFVKS